MATSIDLGKLEEFVFGSDDSCISAIAKEITAKQATLLQLIETSEPFLTNTSTEIRARGVRLVCDVLHLLPKDVLNKDEVRVLASFLCDRLKDHHSITPHTLYGLLALSTATHLPDGTACQILTTIFREVQVQTLLHVDRRSVFNIIGNFLQTRMTELQDKLGSEFVYGFMQVMDGEKDPRNLIILFGLYPVIVQNFPINLFSEELFEVTGCYFPVDFQPRMKDPDAITRDMLADALVKCLASSPKFAPFCLPLLLEKMTSDLDTAKSDSYKALAACAPVYGPVELSVYLVQIWNTIRLEVFQVFNTSTEHAVLSALRSLVQTFSLSPLSGKTKDALNEFYGKVFEGCGNHLRDPELRLLQPCCHILEAIASASSSSCSTVLEFVIPLLLEQGKKDLPVTQTAIILEVLNSFLVVCSTTLVDVTSEPTLSKERQRILEMFMAHLEDSNVRLRAASVQGITSMLLNKGLVDEAYTAVISDLIALRLLNDREGGVRNECATCLEKLAVQSPILVKTRVLPSLWSILTPASVSEEENIETVKVASSHPAWEKLPQLVTDEVIGQEICNHLTQQLSLVSSSSLTDKHCEYGLQLAKTLVETSKKVLKFSNGVNFIKDSVLNQLLQWTVTCAIDHTEKNVVPVFGREEMLLVCSEIFRYFAAELNESDAEVYSSSIVQLFLGQKAENFSFLTDVILSNSTFHPLQASSPVKETRLVVFLQAVICSVKRKVTLPSEDTLFPRCLDLALLSPDWFTSTAACKCLAGILNKYDSPTIQSFVESTKKKILYELKASSDENTSMKLMNLWIWRLTIYCNDMVPAIKDLKQVCYDVIEPQQIAHKITKAFILRGHPLSSEFLISLLDYLEQPVLSSAAAQGIETLLSESSDVLIPKFHAEVRLMYRQRIFQQCLPRIRQGVLEAPEELRPNYLQALSHLLSHIPHQVLMGSLESLMPLFIQSLNQENPLMYLSTLETLHELISEASDLVAPQITSMVPALLKLSQYQPKMKVRIAALKCLKALTQLPHHFVFPYKTDVIRQLATCLNDKKRLVRKEAVDARCSWFLLGTA